MRLSTVLRSLAVLSIVALAGCSAAPEETDDGPTTGSSAATIARPPQLVALAFDGSYALDFWKESTDFAAANNLKFTYFISGTYFIPDNGTKCSAGTNPKCQYIGPHGHGPGSSDIGWGGSVGEIQTRYGWLEKAHELGHEIASHANGHFDGSTWSEADWKSEFEQFDKIFFTGVGLQAPALPFTARDVVGFRAPLLGYSTGLYATLASRHYSYDTSKSTSANYWPEKSALGVWNFPLAQLRIVGSGKATLSMDYNFYFADSKGNKDAANKEKYKSQMIQTYAKYFDSNYYGNRAPIHIGHHFSKWNGGAYWEAMQAFAKRVCGMPEVKCVTYKELMKYMEENAGKRADLQAGNFPKLPQNPGADDTKAVTTGLTQAELAELAATKEGHEEADRNEHLDP